MSASGLEIFDKTLHATNKWLNEISEITGADRQLAWKILGTVLHKIRDRLPVELSAHLGSQLPLMIRGAYYDQYRPSAQPGDCRTAEQFADEVDEWLGDVRPVSPELAIVAVIRVLNNHVDPGQMAKVRQAFPKNLKHMWDSAAEQPELILEPTMEVAH